MVNSFLLRLIQLMAQEMTAMGQSNTISVLAAGGKRTFLKAPDMYMEKLVVGPEVKGMIDLSLPIEQNLRQWLLV